MLYFIIKWVHVLSVMIWVTGLVLQCILLLAAQQKLQASPLTQIIRSWEKSLSIPGLLLVWATGLYLAISGAWYQSHWFMIKATIVFILTGMHGIFAANIRRYYSESTVPSLPMQWFITALFIMVAFVVFLVIVKPF